MLNFFSGGPLDGQAHATTTLLSINAMSMPLAEYKWTPEIVTSEKTGASARVWVYLSPEQRQQEVPVAQPQGERMANKMKSIEGRRKSLNLSRQKLADAAGVTVSQAYRIEKGGARTTAEETQLFDDILSKLEGVDPS